MSELRVPMIAVPTEVVCADGRSFVGRIFVPANSNRHSGPMRAEEWMNEPTWFFALVADEGPPAILNKHEVLVLTVAADADFSEADDVGGPDMPRRRLAVDCGDRRLVGEVVIDMPSNQQRAIDYLNRSDTFLTLRDGDKHHLLRKARITRVVEVGEG